MRDVAQMAGVSLKTVSRVINAEAGVTPATAERVTEAIAAARLRAQRPRGLAAPGPLDGHVRPDHRGRRQPVLLRRSPRPSSPAARDRGFLLITASAREDAERERELVTALLRRRVDALLVVPAGSDHRYIADRVARRLPRPPAARASRPTPC